jgi:ElaB/YqjD/DUF883 family membrane-anchored ribosome-binding protein
MIASTKPYAAAASNAADQAVETADNAIRSTTRFADDSLETLSNRVQDARDQAAPVLSRVAERAEALTRRGVSAVRETSDQVRERALRASDATVGYIKDEPVKSILIAAAAGAALMALVGLISRSRD